MSKKLLPHEVRTEVLNIFNENGEFYSMKEMEAAGRAKGISVKGVKEMVQTLADQKAIETAKIGTLSYYWTVYKDEEVTAKKAKLDELKTTYKELDEKHKSLNEEFTAKGTSEEVQVEESETLKREELLTELKKLKAKELELNHILKAASETSSGSSELEKIQNNMKPLRDAINRWTDNIQNSIDFTQKKLRVEDPKLIYKECNIPENLDYVE